jgi:hypothetical protein
MFDVWLAHRARSEEAKINKTNVEACLGRLKHALGRLVARSLRQRSKLKKMAMPRRSSAKERGKEVRLASRAHR